MLPVITRKTEDKKLLMRYADDDDDLVASDALHRIDDQHFLFEVATNESRTLHDEAPLLYAQMQEHHAIAKLLLEHGADVNVLLYGWTALYHAVGDAVDIAHQKQLPLMEYADWSMVELLLSFGADHSIVCDGLTVFDRLRKWKLLENSPLSNYRE